VIIFVLNGMARLPEMPISLQRTVEIINSVAWLVFALGARILYRYARINFGPDGSVAFPLAAVTK